MTNPRLPYLNGVRRVVVKVGSQVLAPAGFLDESVFDELTNELVAVRERGLDVVLVTSGAVAAGRRQLGLTARPRTIPLQQAAAAAGQITLIESYSSRLGPRGVTVAQMLLSSDDIWDRRRFTNARNTVSTLLSLGVLPIVNENDTVAIEEIKLGDNDRLSAFVTQLVEAQLLILLTDVEGFFDADPRSHPEAQRYTFLERLTEDHVARAGPTTSGVGLGGMVTKLEAARQAALGGASTVIVAGKTERVLQRVLAGEPLGTWIAAGTRLGSRKHWIAYSTEPSGQLRVDTGASRALLERGTSLLPSGLTEVTGDFVRGSIVRVVGPHGEEIGRGVAAYSADDLRRIAGRHSREIREVLGYKYFDEAVRRDDFVLTADLGLASGE